MIETVVKEFFNRIFQKGKELRDSLQDPYEQLTSFVWIYDREDPDYFTGYRMFFEIMAIASMDEGYREVFHQWVNGWVELLEASIEKGIKSGDFKVKDAKEAAKTISAVYQGVASRWFLDPDNHSDEWAKETVKNLIKFIVSKD
ncbi:TetR family transcriptional regulator C-terminal domain-containing protein [Thermotomaculum hydrothermale]|uniref:TetR family transcriptional regulator C-terminal domain-containing protein n=1 Tax=Thermotomaculum hydrothermale TaxID=981385 RepID=UPI0019150581|nr:TetR family transcriptional regulator C-terminal domain-containing protein [Thermotomaculum hydrothermale]